MRILVALTYYRPHVSGLTVYVERLARAWVARGHQVTVLTSQYDRGLARHEQMDGVNVLRMPVLLPRQQGRNHAHGRPGGDTASPEARCGQPAFASVRRRGDRAQGKPPGRPTVLTYHCDVRLPVGIFNVAANSAVNLANRLAAGFADTVVAYTEDYAKHSPSYLATPTSCGVIPPPVEVTPCSEGDAGRVRGANRRGSGPVIGMAARLATEKGVGVPGQGTCPASSTSTRRRKSFLRVSMRTCWARQEYARRLAAGPGRIPGGPLDIPWRAGAIHACRPSSRLAT